MLNINTNYNTKSQYKNNNAQPTFKASADRAIFQEVLLASKIHPYKSPKLDLENYRRGIDELWDSLVKTFKERGYTLRESSERFPCFSISKENEYCGAIGRSGRDNPSIPSLSHISNGDEFKLTNIGSTPKRTISITVENLKELKGPVTLAEAELV